MINTNVKRADRGFGGDDHFLVIEQMLKKLQLLLFRFVLVVIGRPRLVG